MTKRAELSIRQLEEKRVDSFDLTARRVELDYFYILQHKIRGTCGNIDIEVSDNALLVACID